MIIQSHGLTFRPLAQVSAHSIHYLIGHGARSQLLCMYSGETSVGAARFTWEHDGLRRALDNGANMILAAAVEGEANRRAIETIHRYELRPSCNAQPVPSHDEYIRAKLHWSIYLWGKSLPPLPASLSRPANALASLKR